MTSEVERTGFCHYCGQKITLTDCGYDDFWCADPPGGLGTAVCPARDDDRHWPGPDPEDDDLSTPDSSRPTCWRSECRTGCYYPDVCSEKPSTTPGKS